MDNNDRNSGWKINERLFVWYKNTLMIMIPMPCMRHAMANKS